MKGSSLDDDDVLIECGCFPFEKMKSAMKSQKRKKLETRLIGSIDDGVGGDDTVADADSPAPVRSARIAPGSFRTLLPKPQAD